MIYVLDTNVLAAANARDANCSHECSLASAVRLESLLEETIVLDFYHEVMREYSRYADYSGNPGVGDKFFRHMVLAGDKKYVPSTLNELHAAVPPVLQDFDHNDLKWVGLYILGDAERIINSTDSDYLHRQSDFSQCGIVVENVYESELKPLNR